MCILMAIASFQDCLNCAANPNVKTLGTTSQKQANVLPSILLLSDKRRCHVMRRVQALLKAVIRLTITLNVTLIIYNPPNVQVCLNISGFQIATLSVCMGVCLCMYLCLCIHENHAQNQKHWVCAGASEAETIRADESHNYDSNLENLDTTHVQHQDQLKSILKIPYDPHTMLPSPVCAFSSLLLSSNPFSRLFISPFLSD